MENTENYKLGQDMYPEDNILDPITFKDIIIVLRCSCQEINRESVLKSYRDFLEMRLEDAKEILNNNIEELIKATNEGRS